MKQVFEIEWNGGSITGALIESKIRDYFTKMGYPMQNITVKEIIGTGNPEIGANGYPIRGRCEVEYVLKEKSGSSDGIGKESVSPKVKSSVMERCNCILTCTDENNKLIAELSHKLLHVQIPSGMSGQSGLSGKSGPTHPLDDILALISYKLIENNSFLTTIIYRIDI